MPNVNTNHGDISNRTGGKAVYKLLKRGQHLMVLERFGQKDPQPKKASRIRKYRRYHSLPRATAPLAEAVTPPGQKLTYDDLHVVLEQYGDLVEISDVIQDTHEDPVLNEAINLIGEQAPETVEFLRWNALKAGTTVFYPGGAVSRSQVNSPPVKGDFSRVYRFFRRHKAREITEIISASPLVSTEPVAPSYIALGHTDLDDDIRKIPGFVPVEQYSDSSKRYTGEIGKIQHFRIILTALFEPWEAAGASGTTYLSSGAAPASAAQCDVYPLLFIARDAYGLVPLQGYDSITPMVVNPNKATKSDPLGQRGFISWKTYQGALILNQTWIARLEVAATANPE